MGQDLARARLARRHRLSRRRPACTPYLDALGFELVGYGCTTCIGNSGPLPDEIADAVSDGKLVVAAVLSGNRNFEGRVHPQVRANYLASPPLVVAYALAGSMPIDLTTEPLGIGDDGSRSISGHLADAQEVDETVRARRRRARCSVSALRRRVRRRRALAGARAPRAAMTYDWDDAAPPTSSTRPTSTA